MKFLSAFFALLIPLSLQAQIVPENTQQAIVSHSSSWTSSHAEMYLYERESGGAWKQVDGPIKARLGRKGSAWGIGLQKNLTGATIKKEGDGKSPAGVFELGGAWGNAASIKKHPKLPYRKVTPRDLWVEDSKSKHYNQHLILDHTPKTTWEKKQQMKQNDHAHSLKLFIKHNAAPNAIPQGGSAVFFHIWRGGGSKPTAGCTTMPENELKKIVAWVDPTKHPVYILLPKSEYKAKQSAWKLP